MIKAVIFDLDGTLLDTLDDLKDSTNYALSKFGFPKRSKEEIRQFLGNGVKKLIERSIPKGCDGKTEEKCINIFKEHYSLNMYNATKPYNSIVNILKELKQKGIKTAILSNKFDSAVKELSTKYFENLIDLSVGQSEVIPPKPSVKGILKIIKEFDIELDEVILAGDSDVDIKTAKISGIKSIGVTWGFREADNLKDADFIINNPDEIIKIVEKF